MQQRRLPHYKKVAEVVRKRILHGDYALKPVPSERRLAEEVGVNYMTVRRGLEILEKEGLLMRLPNGRLRIKRFQQGGKKHLNFAFLVPTAASRTNEAWRLALERAMHSYSCTVRPVLYMHWDDPTLFDALDGFDGIFFKPIPEEISPAVVEQLRRPGYPLVAVDHDFSMYGIPSIRLFPPVLMQRLLDHLEGLGHRNIGCFNTQVEDNEIRERISQYRYWMGAHGFPGRLIDRSGPMFSNAAEVAYRAWTEILDTEGPGPETAWLCVTFPAAMGMMRAFLDHGIQPGEDVSICVTNSEGFAAMMNPTLTSIEDVDPVPFIRQCLEWMLDGDGAWKGPLLLQSSDVPLVVRESTRPPKIRTS